MNHDNRSGIEDRREASPHTVCTAHSGLNTKTNIQVILSTFAVGMLIISLGILIEIKSGMSANSVAIQVLKRDIDKMELKVKELEHFHIKSNG